MNPQLSLATILFADLWAFKFCLDFMTAPFASNGKSVSRTMKSPRTPNAIYTGFKRKPFRCTEGSRGFQRALYAGFNRLGPNQPANEDDRELAHCNGDMDAGETKM